MSEKKDSGLGHKLGAIVTGTSALLVLAGLPYALVAQIAEPPWEPARSIIELQALWNGGTYGVKYTFGITFFVTTLLAAIPLQLAMVLKGISRPWLQKAPHDLQPLPVKTVSRLTLLAIGLGLLGFAAGFAWLCWAAPASLTSVRLLAILGLAAAPLSALAGPFVLLDALLPASVKQGRVDEKVVTTTPSKGSKPGSATYHVLIAGEKVSLEEALARQVSEGDLLFLRLSAVADRVLEARYKPSSPAR